jgi:hypothetical protein
MLNTSFEVEAIRGAVVKLRWIIQISNAERVTKQCSTLMGGSLGKADN